VAKQWYLVPSLRVKVIGDRKDRKPLGLPHSSSDLTDRPDWFFLDAAGTHCVSPPGSIAEQLTFGLKGLPVIFLRFPLAERRRPLQDRHAEGQRPPGGAYLNRAWKPTRA
jgi:hypothetical protein